MRLCLASAAEGSSLFLLLLDVPAGKIHTPMEYKGELASYDMRLR